MRTVSDSRHNRTLLSGVHIRIRLWWARSNHRFKHAGMTDFGARD